MLKSTNPYTNKLIKAYAEHTDQQVLDKLQCASAAYKDWSAANIEIRTSLLASLADNIEASKMDFAREITHEMGKPITESIAEIEKCIGLCRHYAINTVKYLEASSIETEAKTTKVIFEPLGVLFAIMPWNFPWWQVLRFAVPAVACGNTIIIKHAPNVSGAALSIEKVFIDSGFPEGVLSCLLMKAERSEFVIENPIIKGVTLTGSESAGKAVGALAGKHLKKVVLELGGSDPFIVFEDAHLETCCAVGNKSRMLNAGQVCIAAKRFIVHESLFESFVQKQLDIIKLLVAGDPMHPATQLGPLARPDLIELIDNQVNDAISKGAILHCGGKINTTHPGFYEPTVLSNISDDMLVYHEETFGPVMTILTFNNEEDAVQLVNKSRFGLGASVWTNDENRISRLSRQLDAGSVFFNSMVKSDPRLPFGGIKNSGFGRELGEYGIKEFVNIKTIWVQ